MSRKIISFFVFILVVFHGFAQQKHFYGQQYMKLEAGEFKTIDFGRMISSIVVDVPREEAFSEMAIYANDQKYFVSADADAPLLPGLVRSNIIVFKEVVTGISVQSSIAQNIVVHSLYAEPVNYILPQKNLRLKAGACEKPSTVDQDIWRKDLSGPKAKPAKNTVKHIIVHHTATSNTDTDFVKVMRNIYLYHTQVNGWDDIGYNFLIAPDGTIFQGRDGQDVDEDDNVIGAHFCSKNTGTMGISMIGTFTDVAPTDTALRSLQYLIAWKLNKEALYALDSALHPQGSTQAYYIDRISGHRDGCATECPGDSLYALLGEIRAEAFVLMKDCTPPTISVNNFKLENSFNIYPQPAKDFLYIDIPENALKNGNYKVTDLLGRDVLKGEISSPKQELNTTILKPGIYNISVYGTQGKCFKRFIKL